MKYTKTTIVIICMTSIALIITPVSASTGSSVENNETCSDIDIINMNNRVAVVIQDQLIEKKHEERMEQLNNISTDKGKAKKSAQLINKSGVKMTESQTKRECISTFAKNGNISNYVAQNNKEIVETENKTNIKTIKQSANKTKNIPKDILENNGVNVNAIQKIRQNAENMTGEEISNIDTKIGGKPDDVGKKKSGYKKDTQKTTPIKTTNSTTTED